MSDLLKQQLHGMESIIASDLPFSVKEEAVRQYEQVLAQTSGVTLGTITEVKNVLGRKGLSEKQRIEELKALEKTFAMGAKKTHEEMGKKFDEKEWRSQFRAYANNVYRIRHQRIMERRMALQHLRVARKEQRDAGIKPLPWRQRKPK